MEDSSVVRKGKGKKNPETPADKKELKENKKKKRKRMKKAGDSGRRADCSLDSDKICTKDGLVV